MGDININYLENSTTKKRPVDIITAYNFNQMVDFPTRVVEGGGGTLLDHVYTNIAERVRSVTSVTTHLSDHDAQRITISKSVAPPTHRVGRCYSTANKHNFVTALEAIDWPYIIGKSSNDCQILAHSVISILVNKLELCFPIKKLTRPNSKIWVDEEVHKMKNLLFDVLHLKKVFPSNSVLSEICDKYINKYNLLLNEKRLNYFTNQIRINPNKSKCMWNVINTEVGRGSRERLDYTEHLRNYNGEPFLCKKDVVDALNLEFVSAASRCGAPAADGPRAAAALGAGSTVSDVSIRLRLFDSHEIFIIATKNIADKNSTDIYGLSAKLLGYGIKPVAPTISHLFNLCIREGVYPTALKKVKISPLYKGKGKKSDIKSYRPISLVPAVSKIFEVGLNKRLLNSILSRNILSDRQYAYRAGRSTTDMVREVVWGVLRAREAGRHVALLSCDLSRAFDTADHSLIADKLQFYGIRGPVLSLLTSFISQRTQVVTGDRGRVVSSELENIIGVPQGSCLSNSLFSLLLNDLPSAVEDVETYMYADDVAAVITAPTSQQLQCILNSTVKRLETWFGSNGLALNRDKTCYMIFNLSGNSTEHHTVVAGDSILKQVQRTKLLGFELDSSLLWDSQIDSLCGKLGRTSFALRRLASTVSRAAVRACYFATVHSVLTYGVELWGRAADVQRAFLMQKRALRAIVGASNRTSCRDMFKKLEILPLACELIYQMALFTRTHMHMFQCRGITDPSRTMRSDKFKDRLVTPAHRLKKSERSVYVIGPSVYNRLPDNVRNTTTTSTFKIRLKMAII